MRIGCRSMSPPRVVRSGIHDLGNRDVRADNVDRGYLPISPFRPQDHAAASDFGTREECASSAFQKLATVWNTLEYREPLPFWAASSQAAKWTLVSIAELYARMVSRRVPSAIDRQQQSGLLVRNRVDTKSLCICLPA